MYFYFYCEYAAVIKFQGVIFGTVNNSVKFCNLDTPYPLVEICPLNCEGENIAFYITDNFLECPPKNVSVTDLKGGYFLRFLKAEKTGDFKINTQARFADACFTAFFDNGYKISLETRSGFYADTLAFSFNDVKVTRGEGANSDIMFALFDCGNKKILNAYSIKNPALLFSKEIEEFSVNLSGFTVLERKKDIAKHVIETLYAEKDGEIKELSRKVTCSDNFDREKVSDKLIPYVFAEEFLCGGDYKFYLSEDLKETADKLGGYFGDFIGISPPPLFRDYREIGFIKKFAERKYSVDYFTFEIENGIITNILKI